MVKQSTSQDEKTRKAIHEIARTLEDILREVTDANMKLDHIIKTNRDDHYFHGSFHDPFNGYYQA